MEMHEIRESIQPTSWLSVTWHRLLMTAHAAVYTWVKRRGLCRSYWKSLRVLFDVKTYGQDTVSWQGPWANYRGGVNMFRDKQSTSWSKLHPGDCLLLPRDISSLISAPEKESYMKNSQNTVMHSIEKKGCIHETASILRTGMSLCCALKNPTSWKKKNDDREIHPPYWIHEGSNVKM